MEARRLKDQDGMSLVGILLIAGLLIVGWPALKDRYPEVRRIDRDAQRLVRTAKQEYRASDGARVGDLIRQLR